MKMLFSVLAVTTALWGQAVPKDPGIKAGEKMPAFQLRDQNGKTQTLESLRGPKGLMLVFVRSADW
ncbi:MAG: hypothetical protein HYZ37_19050 [Candidatus Solibacter usitatus]|nr:hypothetical protein [Candidatus Solibacter usitatus]